MATISVPGGVVDVLPIPVGMASTSQISIVCATDSTGTVATHFACGATLWGK
ncbi:MAG: hypothetical protein ACR2FH_03235 [Caulobacteraceae bacterium]